MTFVITRACLGSKDRSCVEVCPVDCFYDVRKKSYNDKYQKPPKGDDVGMLMINPDECIDCGACEAECPVNAIYQDSNVPDEMKEFLEYPNEELLTLTDEELDSMRCTSKTI